MQWQSRKFLLQVSSGVRPADSEEARQIVRQLIDHGLIREIPTANGFRLELTDLGQVILLAGS